MAFDTIEISTQDGKPVELYEFTHGSAVYRYTSSEADVVFDGQTYTARALTRSSIEATQEVARAALTITAERSLPLVQIFNPSPPSEIVTLVLRRFHRDDSEAVVIWMGRILNVGINGLQAQIRCESVYSSVKRTGLRRLYQKPCPHVLYSAPCGVNRDTFKAVKTVTAVNGLQVTLGDMGAFADGYFSGGYMQWITDAGLIERRSIRAHTGAVLTIAFQSAALLVGESVDVYAGCDHTLATCASKFGNFLNYGGMPYIPTKNPFDGSPVF